MFFNVRAISGAKVSCLVMRSASHDVEDATQDHRTITASRKCGAMRNTRLLRRLVVCPI